MRLHEDHGHRFVMSDPAPVFDPGAMMQPLRSVVRYLPTSADVMNAIMSAMQRAYVEDLRPTAILLGSRWYAALEPRDMNFLSAPWGDQVDVLVDSEMERGVRLVYRQRDAFQRWISKQVAADENEPLPQMTALAKLAPTDDGALAVLADWLETNNQAEDAEALRAARRGLQVLARLTATEPGSADK